MLDIPLVHMSTCTSPVSAEVYHTLHHTRISLHGNTQEVLVRDVNNLWYRTKTYPRPPAVTCQTDKVDRSKLECIFT